MAAIDSLREPLLPQGEASHTLPGSRYLQLVPRSSTSAAKSISGSFAFDDDVDVEEALPALFASASKVSVITLEFFNMDVSPAALTTITKALDKHAPTLVSVTITLSDASCNDINPLLNALSSCTQLSQLSVILDDTMLTKRRINWSPLAGLVHLTSLTITSYVQCPDHRPSHTGLYEALSFMPALEYLELMHLNYAEFNIATCASTLRTLKIDGELTTTLAHNLPTCTSLTSLTLKGYIRDDGIDALLASLGQLVSAPSTTVELFTFRWKLTEERIDQFRALPGRRKLIIDGSDIDLDPNEDDDPFKPAGSPPSSPAKTS